MTTPVPSPSVCPRCGTTLNADAPEGLCPRCLAAVNFETGSLVSQPGTTPPLVPAIEEIASHFPQLEILSCLGRGGMGVVYKARQISLDRLVALKLLAPEREMDPEFAERFAREAQALAKMSHPHIVTVHDFGQAGGFFYLLMEYVDGANLRQLLQSHRFTPEQALAVVPPLCDALQYAHERGIVHRDIKPENLLMDREGKLKVADFGLVKMLGSNAAGDERPVGTPSYMAPEQSADPVNVDNRADIYSLGVVIYELLTGELPGKSFQPPSNKASVDSRLDDVVMRAMEQDPDQRYQQASLLKTEVENITRTAVPAPPPSSTSSETPAVAEVSPAIVQPAVAMLVTSLLGIASQLFGALIGMTLLVFPMSFLRNFPLPIPNSSVVVGGMSLTALAIGVWMLVSLGLNVAAAIGALKMRRLQSHSWAIASAIILIFTGLMSLPAAASSSLGGLLSLAQLGAGIWGLVILQREEVKAAFRAAPPVVSPTLPPSSPASTEEALRKVSIPAIGIMVTAMLNFLAMLLVLGIAGLRAVNSHNASAPLFVILFLMLLGSALSTVMFLGGWRMRKLQSHTLAVSASVLALLTPPGLLIGSIFGIWALVVLFDRQVKSAFQSGKTSAAGKGCLIATAVLLAMVMLPALLLGSFWTTSSSSYSVTPVQQYSTVPMGIPVYPNGIPDLPAPPMVEAENGSAADLAARLEASRTIMDSDTRDAAFVVIAGEAAAAGNASIAKQALNSILTTSTRDQAHKTTALSLSDHGLRREAVAVARQIMDSSLRDETLQELAVRPAGTPR